VISGIVTDRDAIVTLTFLLQTGITLPIEFVIDTGFTNPHIFHPTAHSAFTSYNVILRTERA